MTDQEIQEYLLRKAYENHSKDEFIKLGEKLIAPIDEFFKNEPNLMKMAVIAGMIKDMGRDCLIPLVAKEFRIANPETPKKKKEDVH